LSFLDICVVILERSQQASREGRLSVVENDCYGRGGSSITEGVSGGPPSFNEEARFENLPVYTLEVTLMNEWSIKPALLASSDTIRGSWINVSS
jgi:hypothetical protein